MPFLKVDKFFKSFAFDLGIKRVVLGDASIYYIYNSSCNVRYWRPIKQYLLVKFSCLSQPFIRRKPNHLMAAYGTLVLHRLFHLYS